MRTRMKDVLKNTANTALQCSNPRIEYFNHIGIKLYILLATTEG